MVRFCSVPQCRTYCTEPGISFHFYPTDAERRRLWLVRLRNGKTPSKYAMVCSKHFDDGAFKHSQTRKNGFSRKRLRPDALPTLNLPKRKFDRHKLPRKPPAKRIPVSRQSQGPINITSDVAGHACIQEDCPAVETTDEDHTCVQEDWPAVETTDEVPQDDLLEQFAAIVCTHAGTLRDACVQANPLQVIGRPKPLLSCAAVQTDHTVKVLTGLPCLQLLKNIIEEFTALRIESIPRGFALSDEDTVLMVFVKLYHNVSLSFLSVLFSVHRTTVSNILKNAICILASILGEAVFFPSKESVQENLTIYFKNYKETRIVLDCTEVPLERPRDLTSRLLTYSQYKRQYTIKVLIGVAPSGMITLVGKSFGGRASDTQLTAHSNVLNMCTAYVDRVMVDKGFLIENLCDEARVNMDRPPFLKKRQQLEEHEAHKNQAIARARVHVERAIQRVKAFKILQQRYPIQLLPVFDKVIVLLAGIVNLSKPILGEDKFLPNC
ncbi:uncharacterized protein LOC119379490 isoform X1 [Rhipicephalus sanguineus]|uniref:uncharacterized protein LOC119379490 isoform X1 n=1 Tax=Rhipicephalus sanguineus TaxID=34632 RepID=UPI0020C38BD7|nr:uncharacterized protein LOC119379490 isoform X1 [Rhipicephalus sanguineus]